MSMRVLVVDDELLIALDVQDTLETAGHDVIGPASSLASAQRLLQSVSIDAAVLDVNLRGDYIWPVALQLAEAGIPFILLTGYGADLQVPAALMQIPRLAKPVSERDLLLAVDRMAAARGLFGASGVEPGSA